MSRTNLQPATGLKRTANLPGPPKTRPAPTAPQPKNDHQEVDAQPPTPVTTPGKPRPRKASDAAETVRAISLSLPLTVRNQLREHAHATSQSQVNVVLDAVEATVDSLGTLLEDQRPQPAPTGMFDRTPARMGSDEPYVTLSLRMKSTNVTTLDDLTEHHQAASRSQLCAVALRAYLTQSHAQAS